MRSLVLVVALALAACDQQGQDTAADAGAAAADCAAAPGDASTADACAHVAAPLGPGPFGGCTCGDVLRISPVDPDLAECVTP